MRRLIATALYHIVRTVLCGRVRKEKERALDGKKYHQNARSYRQDTQSSYESFDAGRN